MACRISGFTEENLLALATRHVAALESFDADLHAELLGIAAGAGTTPARIVVVNHYTDLRDLRPVSGAGPLDVVGGCTMFYARTPSGPLLGQTWDMHATAAPYTMMMHIPGGESESWVLTLTGCLAMAGQNRAGLAVGINNLTSTDSRIGIVWPALIRRVLREQRAAPARDAVLSAPLGSGHHYLVADEDEVYGVETSGRLREVVYSGEKDWYVHANHCHHPEVGRVSRLWPGSTSRARETALCSSNERREHRRSRRRLAPSRLP